ncbi:hypothetical protein DYY67_1431 [Candidatus Nitrosotalea sp. TS]|uniref:hypothetical protein n=1 Tax=Candidatus Nitrosotalea sp. TS TaxID=2341020 RepID=UPI0014099020|nr:hypothetical protein [Candidatus Nitrosotalea sp. TS]NHI04056.1 hypothetical protein [Candidatus Nitrosotalea sp. TS]
MTNHLLDKTQRIPYHISDKPSTGQNPKDTISITDNPVVTTGSFYPLTIHDSLASQLSDKVESGNLVQDTVTVTDSPLASASIFYP